MIDHKDLVTEIRLVLQLRKLIREFTDREVQAAWHAGLDEGREQGKASKP